MNKLFLKISLIIFFLLPVLGASAQTHEIKIEAKDVEEGDYNKKIWLQNFSLPTLSFQTIDVSAEKSRALSKQFKMILGKDKKRPFLSLSFNTKTTPDWSKLIGATALI